MCDTASNDNTQATLDELQSHVRDLNRTKAHEIHAVNVLNKLIAECNAKASGAIIKHNELRRGYEAQIEWRRLLTDLIHSTSMQAQTTKLDRARIKNALATLGCSLARSTHHVDPISLESLRKLESRLAATYIENFGQLLDSRETLAQLEDFNRSHQRNIDNLKKTMMTT